MLARGSGSVLLDSRSLNQMGEEAMGCGGRVEVLIEIVRPEEAEFVRRIVEAHARGQSCVFIRRCDRDGLVTERIVLGDVSERAKMADQLAAVCTSRSIDAARVTEVLQRCMKSENSESVSGEWGTLTIEVLSPTRRLVIFGAGHVGRHTGRIAAYAGFEVRVVDPRTELLQSKSFASGIQLIRSEYLPWFEQNEVAATESLMIVTPKHDQDEAVLAAALRTPAGYIGMIGSARKVETCLRNLRERGIGAGEFARVHAPIGLDIGAVTAEEIAVSIVAELIMHWRSGNRVPERGKKSSAVIEMRNRES
ncbi:MAG: XdhC family protein [Bacteroidetes bacterium]|nr:XdhC family protein [Bacteroidota bacterium]